MLTRHLLIAGLAALMSASPLRALTVEQTVGPVSTNESDRRFKVTVEKRPDGLLHFKITLALPHPSYLVATSRLKEAGKVISESVATAYARESSATYFQTIAPERLADANFEVYESSFIENNGHPVGGPGGVDFKIDLAAFAKAATARK